MPTRISTMIVLLVAGAASAFGQDVAPPPGFVPGQNANVVPTTPPAPGILPTQNFNLYENNNPGQRYLPAQGDLYPEAGAPYQPPPGPILVGPELMPMPRFWLRAEALYWWTKASPLPVPIVTQGSAADAIPGALGQPGTSVLIGDQAVSFDGRGGGWLALAYPGPEHLIELRDRFGLLRQDEEKPARYADMATRFIGPLSVARLRRRTVLDPVTVRALILMGPNARHIDLSVLDHSPDLLAVTFDISVLFARKSERKS